MNKRNQQLVPLIVALAVLIFAGTLFVVLKPKFEEYNDAKRRIENDRAARVKLEADLSKIEIKNKEQEVKLKAIKPIYESAIDSQNENLGIFGNMFEEIIRKAQKHGLLIRSIEYDMRPGTDPIYENASDSYNACELKFFFVGTYKQLQDFLGDMNTNFVYLTYLSKLSVTAFDGNTDYLLINTSFTLYSKKTEEEQKRNNSGNKKKRR